MKEIRALIAKEMRTLHAQIRALVQHDEQFIQQVNEHVWEAPGKQIRPMFVFLVAGACGGTNTRALRGALLVTLLHQASLAHDDAIRLNKKNIGFIYLLNIIEFLSFNCLCFNTFKFLL